MDASRVLAPFLNGPLHERHGRGVEAADEALSVCSEDVRQREGDSESAGVRCRKERLTPTEPLFSYQRELADRLGVWFEDHAPGSALVSLPTGGGKTRTALWAFREAVERRSIRSALWVAPSVELVEQAAHTIEDLWSRFAAGVTVDVWVHQLSPSVPAGVDGAISLITTQLASRRIREIRSMCPQLLIFDEAHQAAARSYAKVVDVASAQGKVVGLSATPGRTCADEGLDLVGLFDGELMVANELEPDPIKELRLRGVLAKPEFCRIELPPQWRHTCVVDSAKKSMSLEALAANPARFWATVDTIMGIGRESQCLVFGASVAHCYALAGALRVSGVRASVVSYATSDARRARILAQFREGEIDVVLNKSLLATGYDCPAISDVVLASPVRSAILWEQILGRASRGPAVGGGATCRVWELDDHRAMHKKVMSYARYLGDLWR